jgi:hypothetical protein
MTAVFPPLIKPDGRFSRIRLSEFLCRKAEASRYRVICSYRMLFGADSPCGPSPYPSLRLSPAEQVASLRSPAGCPNQRSGTGSSLLRTPPTSGMVRAASPFAGVVPPVESGLLAMSDLPVYPHITAPACRPRRPRRSIIRTLDGWSGCRLFGLRPN